MGLNKNQNSGNFNGEVGDMSNYATKSDLSTKVTKETNKSLVDNTLIDKLEDLENYDDSLVREEINSVNSQLAHIENHLVTINVRNFGAIGDGVTDDTQAIQNAINSLDEYGGTIVFPKGEYIISGVKLKSDISIVGESGFQSFGYSSINATVKIKSTGSYIFDISGCKTVKLQGILFDGNSRMANGLYAETDRCRGLNVSECKFYECNIAIGCDLSKTLNEAIIKDNQIVYCNTAITGILDSRIMNNFINANKRSIYLREGNNDNIISMNKVEWNTVGLECYKSTHNVISNNIFDRQSSEGLFINNANQITITSNVFRRNGADVDTQKQKCHIRLESSNKIIISNNITIANNSKDDGSGINVPEFALSAYNNDLVLITNNDLSGYVTDRIKDLGLNPDLNISLNLDDYGLNLSTFYLGGVKLSNGNSFGKHLESSSYNKTLEANGNLDITLTKKHATQTYYRRISKLKIAYRNESNAKTAYTEFPVVVCRENGNATLQLFIKSDDAVIGNSLNIKGTCNSDGTELYFNIENLLSNKLKMFIELE